MILRRSFALSFVVAAATLAPLLHAQDEDQSARHGRKYKAPLVVSHIEVIVKKAANGKPIENAAVVFRSIKDGKDEGNLEVKTDPEGKAVIDVVPTGSDLRVQVIANGYATFGSMYRIDGPTKTIDITMATPRAQVSAYADNPDQPSERKAGVQEPARTPPPRATRNDPFAQPHE